MCLRGPVHFCRSRKVFRIWARMNSLCSESTEGQRLYTTLASTLWESTFELGSSCWGRFVNGTANLVAGVASGHHGTMTLSVVHQARVLELLLPYATSKSGLLCDMICHLRALTSSTPVVYCVLLPCPVYFGILFSPFWISLWMQLTLHIRIHHNGAAGAAASIFWHRLKECFIDKYNDSRSLQLPLCDDSTWQTFSA